MSDGNIPPHCPTTSFTKDIMKLRDQFHNDLTALQIKSWKGEPFNFQLFGQKMNANFKSLLKKSNDLCNQLMQDFKKKNRQNLTSPTKNVSMKLLASEPNLSEKTLP